MSHQSELFYFNLLHIFSFSVLFILLASPVAFKRTQNIMNKTCGLYVADKDGKPYAFGLLSHSIFFAMFAVSITYNNYMFLFIVSLLYLIISTEK